MGARAAILIEVLMSRIRAVVITASHRLIIGIALAASVGLLGLSCSSFNDLRIYVSNSVPPDFTFSAGRLAECCDYFTQLMVFEEGSDRPLWRISSLPRVVERSEANAIVIHYGKLPERFRQEIPASGEPPALVEGKSYRVAAGGSYIPWPQVRFTIQNGKIVKLPIKDLP